METCEDTPDDVFGFIGFVLVCECAGTHVSSTAALSDRTTAALCSPSFAAGTRSYVQHVMDRPDMVACRCMEICATPLAATLTGVARAIAGEPPLPQETGDDGPFVALAGLDGTIDPGLGARAGGREQELVPRATLPDPADSKAAARTRLVETLCHLDPARPACRGAD